MSGAPAFSLALSGRLLLEPRASQWHYSVSGKCNCCCSRWFLLGSMERPTVPPGILSALQGSWRGWRGWLLQPLCGTWTKPWVGLGPSPSEGRRGSGSPWGGED